MKAIIPVLATFVACAVATSNHGDSSSSQDQYISDIHSQDDAKMHIFVLMVPEPSVRALRNRYRFARQEEEGGAVVSETGAYVGQIISGVLGGDVRPIFAGSTSFIDEPDVQQGVSTILANVAPSINNVLKQWVSRVQTALGITTTPKPGSVVFSNQTRPSNGVIVGRPISAAQASQLTPEQILKLQNQQDEQPASKPQTIEGTNIISGSELYASYFTTVEPLPHINLKPDEDDDSKRKI